MEDQLINFMRHADKDVSFREILTFLDHSNKNAAADTLNNLVKKGLIIEDYVIEPGGFCSMRVPVYKLDKAALVAEATTKLTTESVVIKPYTGSKENTPMKLNDKDIELMRKIARVEALNVLCEQNTKEMQAAQAKLNNTMDDLLARMEKINDQ